MTKDSPKWTLESGPCDREPECLARADLIGWDPKGIAKMIKQNAKWYSPSQV